MKIILTAMVAAILSLQTALAMEQIRENVDEKTTNLFQVFARATLIAKRPEALQAVRQRLKSLPQFAAAFIFDEKNLTIQVHLPHPMVMNIIESCNLFVDCDYSGWSSRGCDLTQYFNCSHERKRVNYIHDAWLSNDKTSPKKVAWEKAVPEKINNFEEIFDFVFNQNGCKGLIFSENHMDFVCQAWLIYLLPTLVKDYGVKTIICELPFQLQPMLDQYFRSQDEELPPELSSCLIYLDQWATLHENNPAGTIADLVKAAKKAGIESVKAADTLMKHLGYGPESSLDRCVTFNQSLAHFYEPNVRSIVFCGFSHATTYRLKNNLEKCAYGLREILGFPALHIFSSLSQPNYGEEGIYFHKFQEFKEIFSNTSLVGFCSTENAEGQQLQTDFEVFINDIPYEG